MKRQRLCPCLHGIEHHPNRGPCMYGHKREEGGTGTPGITGGCRCPMYGTKKSKQSIEKDPDEIEIEGLVREVQASLDRLCEGMKTILRRRREALEHGELDGRAVLAEASSLLRDPPAKKIDVAIGVRAELERRETEMHKMHNGSPFGSIDARMSPACRKLLTVLAQHGECTRDALVAFAGYSPKSGGVREALAEGRGAGWIAGDHRGMVITPDGLSDLGPYERLPTKPAELLEHWIDRLDAAEALMLRVLARHPHGLSKLELCDACEYSPNSGGVREALAALRKRKLVHGGHERIEIARHLRA